MYSSVCMYLCVFRRENIRWINREYHWELYSLQPGAGTIKPEIISSLITGGSVGGGGQTSESIMSSVTRIIPTRSGGSVRDDLRKEQQKSICDYYMVFFLLLEPRASNVIYGSNEIHVHSLYNENVFHSIHRYYTYRIYVRSVIKFEWSSEWFKCILSI